MSPKTPNKRKSTGGDSVESKKVKTEPGTPFPKTPKKEQTPAKFNGKATPKSAKKNAKSPNKQNPNISIKQETPKQQTPKVKTESPKQQTPKVKTESPKKQTPKVKTESPKKQTPKIKQEKTDAASPVKLEKFAGTANLDNSADTSKNATTPVKKRNRRNRNIGANTTKSPKTGSTIIPPKKRKGKHISLEDLTIEKVQTQIDELNAKGKELSKTGRKKLRYLWKVKTNMLAGDPLNKPRAITTAQVPNKKKSKGNKKTLNGKKAVKAEDGESDYDVESTVKVDKISKKMNADASDDEPMDDSAAADSDDEPMDDSAAADSDDADDSNVNEEEDSDVEEEDSDAENEEESDAEEEDVKPPKVVQNKGKNAKQAQQQQTSKKGDKRYVLFVGNLPYDVTKPELMEHFKKVGEIKHIRIPTEQKTNKPRGFAYVEVHTEVEYQKALSLHHTSIKGRRINVLYTEGGKKMSDDKKDKIKQKNVKLHAMRSKGMLAGSVKDSAKRSARRAKAKKNAGIKSET